MRLISQDGTIDVPYESVAVVVTGNYIGMETGSKRFPMATYSTEEKVDEVMEMLHERFMRLTEQQITGRVTEQPPAVFQFPADDEVEI